jgi:hypothetical protein
MTCIFIIKLYKLYYALCIMIGAVGPVSNVNGVGVVPWQNAEAMASRKRYYGGIAAPKPLRVSVAKELNIGIITAVPTFC